MDHGEKFIEPGGKLLRVEKYRIVRVATRKKEAFTLV